MKYEGINRKKKHFNSIQLFNVFKRAPSQITGYTSQMG